MAITMTRNNNKTPARVVSVAGRKVNVEMRSRGAIPVKGDNVIVTTQSKRKSLALKTRRPVQLSDVITHGVITNATRHNPATVSLEIEVSNDTALRKIRELQHTNSFIDIRKIGSVSVR